MGAAPNFVQTKKVITPGFLKFQRVRPLDPGNRGRNIVNCGSCGHYSPECSGVVDRAFGATLCWAVAESVVKLCWVVVESVVTLCWVVGESVVTDVVLGCW